MHHPGEQVYALRLRAAGADDGHPGDLAGEIEHVLSGERRAFRDGIGLIEQLRQLQSRVPVPRTGSGPADVRR